MLTDRIRVLPPFDARGTVIYHGAIGAVVGYVKYALTSNELVQAFYPLIFWIPFAGILLLALDFSVPAVLAWRLARRTHCWWLIVVCGLAYGAMEAFAFQPLSTLDRPSMWGAGFPWLYFAFAMVYVLLIAGLMGGFYLLVGYIFRSTRYSIVIQDGTRCWTCGYIVGSPPISDRCSECGVTIKAREPDHLGLIVTLRRWIKHAARPLAALAVIILAVVIVEHGLRERAAYQPLFGGVAHDGTVAASMLNIDRTTNPKRTIGAWEGVGIWQAVPEHTDKVIVILYDPTPKPGQPPMQLQLMASPAAGGYRIPSTGTEFVVCDLTATQAHYVFEHDLPRSLIESMLEAATATNWRPMIGGGFAGLTDVCAEGHFPDEAKPQE